MGELCLPEGGLTLYLAKPNSSPFGWRVAPSALLRSFDPHFSLAEILTLRVACCAICAALQLSNKGSHRDP